MINFIIFGFPILLFICLRFVFAKKPETRKVFYLFCMLLPVLSLLPSIVMKPQVLRPLVLPDGEVLVSPSIMGLLSLVAIILAYSLTSHKVKQS